MKISGNRPRSGQAKVAVGFQPTVSGRRSLARRVATFESTARPATTWLQASLRDSGFLCARYPWAEAHGYHQGIATRYLRAFSLIEVLCAMLILGVALIGLTEAITVALHSSKDSELQSTAAMIAAGQIETLRAQGGLENGETEGDLTEGLSLYRWKQTITGAGIDGLHEVAVVVENAKSGQSSYKLRTLLFEAPDEPLSTASGKGKDSKGRKRREG